MSKCATEVTTGASNVKLAVAEPIAFSIVRISPPCELA